jgi:hypothetical protein
LHIHDAAVIMLLPPKEILEERMTNISKPLDMPICEAYYEWKIAANKFNVPIFYFLDTEGVNLFASLVDGDHKGG